ncbi:MAG: LytTR family DNA-binding domain-containing protein [Bacteroidetes bacterium]|nr:LytTR family DNA-binding domain-containing protein [Bacteroidota bacterium]
MIRTIIIDDELHIREMIEQILSDQCSEVQVVASVGSVAEGLNAIQNSVPDLLLLDIKMPDGTGFDLLQKLENISFKIIFITAFEEHAIKAFQFSAVDYLLKPVDTEGLIRSIQRAVHTIQAEMSLKLNTLFGNINAKESDQKKIILKTLDQIHVIRINEIIHLESDQNYTVFHVSDGKKILVSRTLKDFEEMLGEHSFFRVHKSHLINLGYIDRFEKAEGGTVVMSNASRIPVASRKRDQLLELFEKF